MPYFLTVVGIEEFELPDTDARHANPETTDQLSDRALRNLQSFWAMEFAFYKFFKEMERTHGEYSAIEILGCASLGEASRLHHSAHANCYLVDRCRALRHHGPAKRKRHIADPIA